MILIKVKCIPTKELFRDFILHHRIISCIPIDNNPEIQLNKYGNFTISGSNLDNIQLNQEANIIITPDNKSKYEASYIMLAYEGVDFGEEGIVVDPRYELEILSRLMEVSQAKNVNDAYPNFVSLVLNNKQDTIQHKNIKNVGQKRLDLYISKVQADCKAILFYPTAFDNGIVSGEDIRELQTHFNTPDELKNALSTNPYHVYVDLVGYSFDKADRLVAKHHPKFIDSKERCEYGCLEILKENEYDGDTRLNANLMASEAKKLMPEAKHHMVEAVKNSELIHYDEDTKYASIEETYQDELLIAEHILARKNEPMLEFYPMNWQEFKTVDGFSMTEEQTKILELVGNGSRINLLTGGGGCVDCDTEFFNGKGWKKIADYQEGDKVLQYNQDGSTTLVNPERYIKLPCNSLWHFETKYGLNQTICNEHRIVYWSAKGHQHECTIQEIIKGQSKLTGGWNGRIKTAFNYSGNGINLTDAEIKIMCAVICDGTFTEGRNTNLCRFHIKKDRKKEKLRELFQEADINWREKESTAEGYTDFYIYAPMKIKHFTPEWYNCTNHQLQIICDNLLFWDGNKNTTINGVTRRRFSTSIKETADFVQFAFSACGYRASIGINDRVGQQYFTCDTFYERKSVDYTVTITDRIYVGLCVDERRGSVKTPITQVPTTDGFKYCFTVPSGMLVLRRKDCIFITGNCGKTASIKALIRMLEANRHSYTLLAPTGVAAKRMRESTGRPASTIHMFLAHEDAEAGEYVIIDETSMVAVQLLAKLLQKIGKAPNLIFVCDEAQLASISCGNIVQDLIDSGAVPRANLTKVFRYGVGGIATIATDARMGTMDNLSKSFNDFKFVPIDSSPIEQVLEEYDKLIEKGYKKDEILVLSPYNKGHKGTYEINKAIQSRYNANDYTFASYQHQGMGKIQFKVGDMVLNTKNNYRMPSLEMDDDGFEMEGEMQCMNGDIGVVRECRGDEKNPMLVVQFDEGMAAISGSDIANLLLGYSVSIHKVQGAQNKAIIVVIDKEHKRLLSRNLMYVAFSRAQEYMVVIADEDVLKEGLDVQENLERDTWLGEMLKEGLDE